MFSCMPITFMPVPAASKETCDGSLYPREHLVGICFSQETMEECALWGGAHILRWVLGTAYSMKLAPRITKEASSLNIRTAVVLCKGQLPFYSDKGNAHLKKKGSS